MTADLDKELEDSQRIMMEIKTIFNTVPNGEDRPQLNQDQRQEQLARYLAANGPQLLMPDMEEAVVVDIETILNGLKSHAESLKNKVAAQGQLRNNSERPIENLNLEECAASLDDFSKRLANIKLNTTNGNNRNRVLEMKLAQLCEDVNNLKQVNEIIDNSANSLLSIKLFWSTLLISKVKNDTWR